MQDVIQAYIKRVRDLAEHVRGNEQATKKSLIEPLFSSLGYDVTDPRECIPEHREDFGKNRSAKPVDYAFCANGKPAFFVEAKEVGQKLRGYDEQLADYFAKSPGVALGILTNGSHWRFFTDLDHENVMDKKPFLEWHVLGDATPPWDFLRVLQKAEYSAELIRTFAQRTRAQNLLVEELTRLLEPDAEFVRMAIRNLEPRNLTANVVDGWKPVLKAALGEWAKQQRLSSVLEKSGHGTGAEQDGERVPKSVETTQAELDAFATIVQSLGSSRPVEYEDTASYFKIHIPGKPSSAIIRLLRFDKRKPQIRIALPDNVARSMIPSGIDVTASKHHGWCCVSLRDRGDIDLLGEAFKAAWDREQAPRA